MKTQVFCRLLTVAVALGCAWATVSEAQNSFDEFKKRHDAEFADFRAAKTAEYEEFRRKANEEYAAFLNRAWGRQKAQPPKPAPPAPPEPVIVPYEEPKPTPEPAPEPSPKPVVIEDVITPPAPAPQPEPVRPIQDSPEPAPKRAVFTCFGTQMEVRWVDNLKFDVKSARPKDVSAAWKVLSGNRYNDLVKDCLELRRSYVLNDWAYLQMLHSMSSAFMGNDSNEATLLMAFIYCQSGYKMRLGAEGNKLVMLFGSEHLIYKMKFITINAEDFYPFNFNGGGSLDVSSAQFPGEKPMSLVFNTLPKYSVSNSSDRELKSKGYPNMGVVSAVNTNLIKFFDTYPTSALGGDMMTRWAMYANTPISPEVRARVYPQLKEQVAGMSSYEAVSRLLNWVQTAFVYEYDNKVWGEDRAFFSEETLYYPYCDCEDRSILFSRLVRDIVGLDAVLVYYPGHLAAAVDFGNATYGDYLILNGRKFTICDPTYINAPVGKTMPDMDNSSAKAILLER